MGVPRREPRPASAERRALGSPREGGGAGAGIANVELPAIARLAGGNSVSLPATTPNSAHLRPTRRPDAAFMRHRAVLRNGPVGDPLRTSAGLHLGSSPK